nr:hypothetical protein [Tanacetum cinerariifolium]
MYKEAVVDKYGQDYSNHPIFDVDVREYCSQEEGFTPNYTSWWAHGETASRFQHEGQSSTPMKDDDVDGCTQMNIDVFLRPLVDELITLYNDGIETYDVAHKENFIMKVVLLWTVSDFLAYAMLSGWSTHGKLACPYCMGSAKTKDNVKASKDVKKYCNRAELHIRQVGTKDMKPKASYTLTKHKLLPIALRGLIPNSIWDVITELSIFFRAICARVLHTSDLILLQQSVVETIYKLEKIFPPGFFDSMEHLVFDDSVRHTQPQLNGKGLENYRDKFFVEWLEQHPCESSDYLILHLKGLARGPLRHAWSYKGYFINGFKFHTEKYGEGRVTHNSEVCVKGACYNKSECDFYGMLEEVIEVAYHGVEHRVVILFKCKWFDAARGTKSRSMYELEDCENKEDVGDNAGKDEFFQASETLIPVTSRSLSEIDIC